MRVKYEMYEKVLLKSGDTAHIVEIYEDGRAYEMDIDKRDGTTVTDTVWADLIERKL